LLLHKGYVIPDSRDFGNQNLLISNMFHPFGA
jgi:hypothetical protein